MPRRNLPLALLVILLTSGCSGPMGFVEIPAPKAATPDPVHVPYAGLPSELRSYLERYAGKDPSECGFHSIKMFDKESASEEMLRYSVSCGLAAAKSHRPFWTFKQDPSEDSFYGQGLVGTAEGAIYRFRYDSQTYGPGRITFELCPKPAAATEDRRIVFRCLASLAISPGPPSSSGRP